MGGCVGGGIEGRAQNIAPLHLMRCLIAGYNLVGALQGRAQNIAPLQVGGIVAVVAIEAIDAIEAIEAIEDIVDMGFWGCGLGGMEEIKKSASPKKNCACGGWRGLNVVRGTALSFNIRIRT